MRKKELKLLSSMLKAAIILGGINPIAAQAAVDFGWEQAEDGCWYWYEDGVKQGTEGRGKEIYDPESDAWYWLDSIDGGKRAEGKDVYQDSGAGPYADREDGTGKWCRYDTEGGMVKGWDINEDGTYYFDYYYGAMLKGEHEIDGVRYFFNCTTGIMENCSVGMDNHWADIDGTEYWYEGGIRQGYDPHDPTYRGKEIYDPGSQAWYWLDNVDGGRKAVNKDVYQEYADGSGKWVRYDGAGRMVKGWQEKDGNRYYFDLTTGAMAKGIVDVDGRTYQFDSHTGVCLGEYNADVYTTWVLAKEEGVDRDGNVTVYGIYEYDENSGYLSKTTIPQKETIVEYERDDQGRTIREMVTDVVDGSLLQENHYTYDSDGNMMEEMVEVYKANKEIYWAAYKVYEYENGLLMVENTTDYVGEKADKFSKYEYSYDKNGNKVECVYSSTKGTDWDTYHLISREVYEYDQYGSEIGITCYKWDDNKADWERSTRTEQTYMYVNNKAYLMSQINYDSNDTAYSSFQYERNEDGSPKKYTSYRYNEISYYVVYGQAVPPEEGDSYININVTFDKDGRKTGEDVYYYSKLIFVNPSI